MIIIHPFKGDQPCTNCNGTGKVLQVMRCSGVDEKEVWVKCHCQTLPRVMLDTPIQVSMAEQDHQAMLRQQSYQLARDRGHIKT